MYCSNCGKEGSGKFCRYCGAPLESNPVESDSKNAVERPINPKDYIAVEQEDKPAKNPNGKWALIFAILMLLCSSYGGASISTIIFGILTILFITLSYIDATKRNLKTGLTTASTILLALSVVLLISPGIPQKTSKTETKSEYSYSAASYKSNETIGQRNALKSAKSYLRSSSFSYEGLIKQLEYEGFTNDEATYGVNNCGADWNDQARKSAASYLRSSSFSRDGLIKQLEYEGFTTDQAEYGVTQNGY